ncbi:MAG: hypothetical protein DRN12_02425 [Thermoplasmata archaeon]|nr:MAG: hypothetical protein DRN12_02425 [Thermoplasmata archaeon]
MGISRFKRGLVRIHHGISIVIILYPILFSSVTSAEDLIHDYAPIFYFEREETCYPVNVFYYIDHSYLYYFREEPQLLATNVTPKLLAIYSNDSNYYLDNQLGTPSDKNIIEEYHKIMDKLGYTLYARIINIDSTMVLQYWMFYVFNNGVLNQHEGDWELVQIVFLEDKPIKVMYSQHYSGQQASWSEVEKNGKHIHVYVARGSHANYFRSYAGKLGAAEDYVASNGKILYPSQYNIINLTDQHWLLFSGRWGEINSYEDIIYGEAGPFGPMYKDNGAIWHHPIEWGNSLSPLNNYLLILEWILYNFLIIFISITLLSISILAYRIYKRYKSIGLGPRIFSIFYIDGLNRKSIGNIILILSIFIAVSGLFYTWYNVTTDLNIDGYATSEPIKIISIDGVKGLQINLLDPTKGSIGIGSFILPFSLILGIGLLLFIVGTIGINKSRKLGRKYIIHGIKLLLPILMLILILTSIRFFVYQIDSAPSFFREIIDDISKSPLNGNTVITVDNGSTSGEITVQWGVASGGYMLLAAGVMMTISGLLLIREDAIFFDRKRVE